MSVGFFFGPANLGLHLSVEHGQKLEYAQIWNQVDKIELQINENVHHFQNWVKSFLVARYRMHAFSFRWLYSQLVYEKEEKQT